MDNELFELCQEVARLTGWDGNGELYKDGKGVPYHAVPLYTSDYLLEKLHQIDRDHDLRIYWSSERKEWVAMLRIHGEIGFADTPLKALLKLTLALSDAGELK